MEDDEPLFIAKDICQALGLENTSAATVTLQSDELLLKIVTSGGQRREMQAVTESGLYALIFKSRKPEAQKFRRWVTGEVLPAIRRHGRYDPVELARTLPPLARRGLLQHRYNELEIEMQQLRNQLDLALVLPGQMTTWQWMLTQGWEPGRGECGRHAGRCVALSALRGLPVGEVKVVEHAGQITRLSRTAKTFEPEILREVIGEAA